MSMMRGKDRCMKRPCWAWLTGPDSRQSRDRIPLVTLVKAKLAALKMTDTLLGVERFRFPSRLLYCSHMLNACSQARQRLDDAYKAVNADVIEIEWHSMRILLMSSWCYIEVCAILRACLRCVVPVVFSHKQQQREDRSDMSLSGSNSTTPHKSSVSTSG